MDIDFFEKYLNSTNTELLMIIEQADDYQPKAVDTAKKILETRIVTDAERLFVINELNSVKEREIKKKEKVDKIISQATELIEPFMNPKEKFDYGKWFYILCICLASEYIFISYSSIKYFIGFWSCDSCEFGINEFLQLINLIYIPLFIYLLFKRNKWGWILTLFTSIFVISSRLSSSYYLFKYIDIHHGDPFTHLFPVIYHAFMIYNLLKIEVKELFKIDILLQKRTINYSVLICVIIFGLLLIIIK